MRRNHVLDAGQDWTNLFAALTGDKSAMGHFSSYFGHLFITGPPTQCRRA